MKKNPGKRKRIETYSRRNRNVNKPLASKETKLIWIENAQDQP